MARDEKNLETDTSGEYRPIGDYALIGDCHTAALVSRAGGIDWCCWPHLDSGAVFCRLLDARRGGTFAVAPVGLFDVLREYVEGTNVLATTFRTSTGEIRLTDFMPAEPKRPGARGEDIEESHQILRLLEGLAGSVDVDLRFHPTFNYARAHSTIAIDPRGATATGGADTLRLNAPVPLLEDPAGGVTGTIRITAGQRVWLSLSDVVARDIPDPEASLQDTLAYWREWSKRCTYRGPYHDYVRRSALVLKLLTFEPTGALIAAPTTSLPEDIGGVRNWDYRYAWLRDSSLILYALQSIGYHEEAFDFFKWLESICLACQDTIQVVYRLDGGRDLPEQVLPHLEGYRGSRPVRIGNAAARQTQLDIYGEVLDAAHLCYEGPHRVDSTVWQVLSLFADRAAARWQEPDDGIWEVRSGPRQFVYSKLLCWVALDRAVRLAEEEQMHGDVAGWRRTRDEIRDAILGRGYSPSLQAFTQSFDSDVLDASALVLPLVGFLPPTDPRVRSTVKAIQKHLTSNSSETSTPAAHPMDTGCLTQTGSGALQ